MHQMTDLEHLSVKSILYKVNDQIAAVSLYK